MSWIESHQELGRHPKTRRMAKTLGVSRPAIVGHLHYLWWWALDFAQDGELTEFDNDELAEAALWDGDSVEFFNALESSGFVDTIRAHGEDARQVLHDWEQYAGKLVSSRKANADKQKAWREKQKGSVTESNPTQSDTVTDTLPLPLPLPLPLRDGATVPYSTVPEEENTPKTAGPFVGTRPQSESKPEEEKKETSSGQEQSSPKESGSAPPRKKADKNFDVPGFNHFYLAYPRKQGRQEAIDAWNKLRPDSETQTAILAAVSRGLLSDDWREEGGKYVPYPATFLNKKRWEDEPMPGSVPVPASPPGKMYDPASNPRVQTLANAPTQTAIVNRYAPRKEAA